VVVFDITETLFSWSYYLYYYCFH